MEIVKGKHIILKRDKLSYDTNILGRWENYKIDTYQGTVLKEAAERYKVLLKSGFIPDSEVAALKDKLSLIPTARNNKAIDLWSLPEQDGYVKVPESEKTAIEIIEQVIEDTLTSVPPTPTTKPVKPHKGNKWLITAGTTKSGRKRYVNVYNDCNDWDISVVPLAMTKTKAYETLTRVKREYKDKQITSAAFPKRTEEINFEIIEYTGHEYE